MVRHSVYFWLDPELTTEQKTQFEEGMEALFAIDTVVNGSYGAPAATPTRPVTENTFDYALSLDFQSVADHDAYQVDPDHDVFVEKFAPWFKTVKIFDAEIS